MAGRQMIAVCAGGFDGWRSVGLGLMWALQGAERFFRACSASRNVIICGFPATRSTAETGTFTVVAQTPLPSWSSRSACGKSITWSVLRTIEVVRRVLE